MISFRIHTYGSWLPSTAVYGATFAAEDFKSRRSAVPFIVSVVSNTLVQAEL